MQTDHLIALAAQIKQARALLRHIDGYAAFFMGAVPCAVNAESVESARSMVASLQSVCAGLGIDSDGVWQNPEPLFASDGDEGEFSTKADIERIFHDDAEFVAFVRTAEIGASLDGQIVRVA